jgi:polyferredoxin
MKDNMKKKKKKKSIWESMWILSSIYIVLSPFNILFAWLGLLCFFVPLFISIFRGNKAYCNKYCGRGQLLDLLGNKLKLSRKKPMPKWMKHKFFRYGFLTFFFIMFFNMLFNTFLVFREAATLKQIITILWTFKVPWKFYEFSSISPWITQFAFGFYSVMLTSTILGVITMALYMPRSWCVYCPMGTMTQVICKVKSNTNQL